MGCVQLFQQSGLAADRTAVMPSPTKSPLVVPFDPFLDFDSFAPLPGPGSYDTTHSDIARTHTFNHRSGSFGSKESRTSWVHEPRWLSGPLKPPRLASPEAAQALAFADAPWRGEQHSRRTPPPSVAFAGGRVRPPVRRVKSSEVDMVWDATQNRLRPFHELRHRSATASGEGALIADRVSPARAREVAKRFGERERQAVRERRARSPRLASPRPSSAPPTRPGASQHDAYGALAANSAAEEGARYARALNSALTRAGEPASYTAEVRRGGGPPPPEDAYEAALRQSRVAAHQRASPPREGSGGRMTRVEALRRFSGTPGTYGGTPPHHTERPAWVVPSPLDKPLEAFERENDAAWLARRKAVSDDFLKARDEERRPPNEVLEAAEHVSSSTHHAVVSVT